MDDGITIPPVPRSTKSQKRRARRKRAAALRAAEREERTQPDPDRLREDRDERRRMERGA